MFSNQTPGDEVASNHQIKNKLLGRLPEKNRALVVDLSNNGSPGKGDVVMFPDRNLTVNGP